MPCLEFKRLNRDLLLIAAFSAAAMLPAIYYGVPSSNDQAQHYQFAWTVYESIRSGEIYPSVTGVVNHGFGDVGLRFYPPLAFYILSFLNLLISDWYITSLLAFTFVFFAGGVGVYLWAREEFEPQQALIAAALYTFAPYHLNLIYNNFLLAEFFATAILPFCFLFLTRVCRRGRWVDVCGLSAAYALLILTHLPMTIIGSMAIGLYGLVLLRNRPFVPTLARLFVAVAVAMAMTSFYWSRMLPELEWVQHFSPKFFADQWGYSANFLLYPGHFINFGENALNLWFADVMLLTMLVISIPTVIYFVRGRAKNSRFVLGVTVGSVLGVFMTTPLSAFIWDNVGLLQKVQFPWRWMSIVSLFGALFASIGIKRASDSIKEDSNVAVTIGLGFVLVIFVFTAAFIIKGAVFVSRSALDNQVENTAQGESCECWWPVWANRQAFEQTRSIVSPSRDSAVEEWSAGVKHFMVTAGEPTTATLKVFYYPRWQAFVNGEAVPIDKTANGAISLAIPAASSDVRLVFVEPAYVKAASIFSAAAWLFVIAFAAVLSFKRRGTAFLMQI